MVGAYASIRAYKETQVATASQGELILLAYDGALKWVAAARAELEREKPNPEKVHRALMRAQAIVEELQGALRMQEGGELAANLNRLYDYILHLLMEANIHKDLEKLVQAQTMLRELYEAWVQIVRGDRREPAPTEASEAAAEQSQGPARTKPKMAAGAVVGGTVNLFG